MSAAQIAFGAVVVDDVCPSGDSLESIFTFASLKILDKVLEGVHVASLLLSVLILHFQNCLR